MEIKRDLYLNKIINRKHNGLIKVITGIRRCGKSYLLFNLYNRHLLESGVSEDHIIKIAFDMRKNSELRNPDKLCEYVESKMTDKGHKAWQEYFTYGGLPLVASMKTDEQKRDVKL